MVRFPAGRIRATEEPQRWRNRSGASLISYWISYSIIFGVICSNRTPCDHWHVKSLCFRKKQLLNLISGQQSCDNFPSAVEQSIFFGWPARLSCNSLLKNSKIISRYSPNITNNKFQVNCIFVTSLISKTSIMFD